MLAQPEGLGRLAVPVPDHVHPDPAYNKNRMEELEDNLLAIRKAKENLRPIARKDLDVKD